MSGGSESTKSTVEPPSYLKPYLEFGAKEAGRLYGQDIPGFFPGPTVAPFSPTQQLGINAAAARGAGGSPVNAAAGKYITDTLGGAGTYMDPIFANVRSRVQPSVAAQFSQGGRYGSDAHADTTTRALTEAYSPFALSAAQHAASLAPQIAGQDWTDIQGLMGAGGMEQGQAQKQIGEQMQRYDYANQAPWQQLAMFSGALNPFAQGQTQTQRTSGGGDLWSTLFGVPLAAASAAGSLGWSPFAP